MWNHFAGERLWFSGHPLPPGFELRLVALAPGCKRPYHDAEWRDAIVVIECGEVELEGASGTRYHFGRGAVLWLTGLPLRALYNPGEEHAVLVAIARRHIGFLQ